MSKTTRVNSAEFALNDKEHSKDKIVGQKPEIKGNSQIYLK